MPSNVQVNEEEDDSVRKEKAKLNSFLFLLFSFKVVADMARGSGSEMQAVSRMVFQSRLHKEREPVPEKRSRNLPLRTRELGRFPHFLPV